MFETGLSLQTVQKELRNLVEIGIVNKRKTDDFNPRCIWPRIGSLSLFLYMYIIQMDFANFTSSREGDRG